MRFVAVIYRLSLSFIGIAYYANVNSPFLMIFDLFHDYVAVNIQIVLSSYTLMLTPQYQNELLVPVRETLKAMVKWGWKVELDENKSSMKATKRIASGGISMVSSVY